MSSNEEKLERIIMQILMENMAKVATDTLAEHMQKSEGKEQAKSILDVLIALAPSKSMLVASVGDDDLVLYKNHCNELLGRSANGQEIEQVTSAEVFLSLKAIIEEVKCDDCKKGDCNLRDEAFEMKTQSMIVFEFLFRQIFGEQMADDIFTDALKDIIEEDTGFTESGMLETEQSLKNIAPEIEKIIDDIKESSSVKRRRESGHGLLDGLMATMHDDLIDAMKSNLN